jgi:uncharacterized membrane protein
MLAMEERREKFEKQMEQDGKDFELRLEEINKLERKLTDMVMISLAVAGIIFALAEIFAALAALTPDSILFQWFR